MASNNSRIEWVDALKGFLILLVVMGHLTQPVEKANALYTFIYTFHMPLFFWVSGFLSINLVSRQTVKYLSKKTTALLLPFISFAIISSFLHGVESPTDFFLRINKHGYWFLLTLFFFSLFLITSCKIASRIYECLKKHHPDRLSTPKVLLFIELSLMGLIEVLFILCFRYAPETIQNLVQLKTFILYWPYYVLGYAISQYRIKIPDFVVSICGVVFFVVWYSSLQYGVLTHEIIFQFSRLCATAFFFYCFMRITPNRVINRLGFLGRETLCIYVMHYFFISGVGAYIVTLMGGITILETVAFVFFSIIIALLCIVIKRLICTNKLLGLLLFGQK